MHNFKGEREGRVRVEKNKEREKRENV